MYTVLATVSLAYGPIRTLLRSVTTAVGGVAAMGNISEFMDAPEVHNNPMRDDNLEQGLIIISNLLASYRPAESKPVKV